MFMVFSREKMLSYLVSLGTVTLLFVISFAMTTKNDDFIETSANMISTNKITNSQNNTNANQLINNITDNNQTSNDIKETNCVNNL